MRGAACEGPAVAAPTLGPARARALVNSSCSRSCAGSKSPCSSSLLWSSWRAFFFSLPSGPIWGREEGEHGSCGWVSSQRGLHAVGLGRRVPSGVGARPNPRLKVRGTRRAAAHVLYARPLPAWPCPPPPACAARTSTISGSTVLRSRSAVHTQSSMRRFTVAASPVRAGNQSTSSRRGSARGQRTAHRQLGRRSRHVCQPPASAPLHFHPNPQSPAGGAGALLW